MMPPADLISDLCDDLLLHILRFLSEDASDVVCTSALSSRWRSLWTRAPVLRLINRKGRSTDEDVGSTDADDADVVDDDSSTDEDDARFNNVVDDDSSTDEDDARFNDVVDDDSSTDADDARFNDVVDKDGSSAVDDARFNDFVDAVLARRAHDVDRLQLYAAGSGLASRGPTSGSAAPCSTRWDPSSSTCGRRQ